MLLDAVKLHFAGSNDEASKIFARTNQSDIRDYAEKAWGKGSVARHKFIMVPNSPLHLQIDKRPKPRMPDLATKRLMIQRDGFHCRFCGMPVIDATLRKLIMISYADAVEWGNTNLTQHAAFQCMWLQYDHILPNSRGGASTLDNMVIACAPCNFGRMHSTIAEARLIHPLTLSPPIAWKRHDEWDGLETFRETA